MKGKLNEGKQRRGKNDFLTPAKARKEKWKEIIVRLYLEGNSMEVVKEKAKIETGGHSFSIKTVHAYIHEALDVWKKSKDDMVQNHKAIELEKINRLEATYWDGWYRSLLTVKTVKTKKAPTDTAAANGKSAETTVKRRKNCGKSAEMAFNTLEVMDEARQTSGDVRFLQGVDRCVELRLKILGTDTPPKIEVNTSITNNPAVDNSTTLIRKVIFRTRETTSAPQTFINPENN